MHSIRNRVELTYIYGYERQVAWRLTLIPNRVIYLAVSMATPFSQTYLAFIVREMWKEVNIESERNKEDQCLWILINGLHFLLYDKKN